LETAFNHKPRENQMGLLERLAVILCLVAVAASSVAAADEVSSWDETEAVSIATDVYIYGYPLVTFDMVRQQQTNVATPDAEHAPISQVIKMRSYPAVDNHCCAAPMPIPCIQRSGSTFRRSHGSSAFPT
jgi:hypothetical protein